ncbi:Hypothetical protein SRAE_2000366800 [Strongyloides ratti]|uniref:Uncharacterized protein n=1 Tax=Strongyloides ratti TaxID=34506 RepID=A0A090LGT7_STRRB|nr:Hypothetical protein SRAE_2000366800 [Strongyloides ratti]CEF69016.1 Hypothetical protein SRAE_2000366800 [Strongyloides ratti]
MSSDYTTPWEKFLNVNQLKKKKFLKKINYSNAIKDLTYLCKLFRETYGPEYEAIIYSELAKLFLQLKCNTSSALNLKKKEKCYWEGLLKDKKYGSNMFSAVYLNWYGTNVEIINFYTNLKLNLKANISILNFSVKLFKICKISECISWVSMLIQEFYDFPIFWYKSITLITKCYLMKNCLNDFVMCLSKMKTYIEECKKRLINDFFIRKFVKECVGIQKIINLNFPSHKKQFFEHNYNTMEEIDEFSMKLYNNSSDKEKYFHEIIAKKYEDFKLLIFFCKWAIKNSNKIENNTDISSNTEPINQNIPIMLQYKNLLKECNLLDDEKC